MILKPQMNRPLALSWTTDYGNSDDWAEEGMGVGNLLK